MYINETNEVLEPGNRLLYFTTADSEQDISNATNLLIVFHGLVNREKRSFPINNGRMYKKHLESSWLCIGVCDPLLFDDPALGGSFFLGKPGAKYVDALIERMEDLFTTSPKLRNVFVIGGSASAIIALAVSSRLKAINISFGPIFYLENYYKHLVKKVVDGHWDGDREFFIRTSDEIVAKSLDFKRMIMICNATDYNHNVLQSFKFYQSLLEIAGPNRAASFLESEAANRVHFQVLDLGVHGHFVPPIEKISHFLTALRSCPEKVPNFSITDGLKIPLVSAVDNSESRKKDSVADFQQTKDITDAIWLSKDS